MWFWLASFAIVLLTCVNVTVAQEPIPNLPSDVFQSNPPLVKLTAKSSKLRRPHLERQLPGTSLQTLRYAQQAYNAILTIGSFNYELSLDTASSDLWLLDESCQTQECTGHPLYPNSHYSPSFSAVNQNMTSFNVSYHDGSSATGFVAREKVSLAAFELSNQALGLVHTSSVPLASEVSGVLGLGFPRLSRIAQTVTEAVPFVVRLAQEGRLAYPLFGLRLQRNSSAMMTLGAIDSTVVPNVTSIGWNQIASFGEFGQPTNASVYLHWALRLSGIMLNGTDSPLIPTYPNITGPQPLALIDVGVNGIYGPHHDVANLYSKIPNSRLVGESTWAVPCNSPYSMTFMIGARNYILQLTDLIVGQVEGTPHMCLTWPRSSPPSADGIDWQLGIPFLQTVYSVFSYGINQKEPPFIGFAPLHSGITQVETPGQVSSFLASASTRVASTLPNVLLPSPTYTTPLYLFNTSVPTPTGVASSGFGTSTYSRLINQSTITALPTIAPIPAIMVLTVTDGRGSSFVTTSALPTSSVVLGMPKSGASKSFGQRTPTGILTCFIFSLMYMLAF